MLRTIRARLTLIMAVTAMTIAGLGIVSAFSFYRFSRSIEAISSRTLQKTEVGYGLAQVAAGLTALIPQIQNNISISNLDALQQQFDSLLDQLRTYSGRLARLEEEISPDGINRQAAILRTQSREITNARKELFDRQQHLHRNLISMEQNLQAVLTMLNRLPGEHGHTGDHRREHGAEWDEELAERLTALHNRHAVLHNLMVQHVQETDPERIAQRHQAYIQQLQMMRKDLADIRARPLHADHQAILDQLSLMEDRITDMPPMQQKIRTGTETLAWQAHDFINNINRLSNGVGSLSATVLERSRQELNDIVPMRIRGNLAILMSTAIGILLTLVASSLISGRGIATRIEQIRDQLVTRQGQDDTPLPVRGADELSDICHSLNHIAARARDAVSSQEATDRELQQAREQAERALSELRTTQRSLIQSEKMASIASLVSNVAHEINTPLGAAVGVVTHLSQRLDKFAAKQEEGPLKRQDVKAFFEFVSEGATLLQDNIERTIELAAQFKQVVRQQDLEEVRLVHFGDFLEKCVDERRDLFEGRDIDVAIHCPDNMEVAIHPSAMTQVLTTLLMNSISHGFTEGQKGLISIMASPGTNGGISILYEDNGGGMSEEEKDRIFDPYFQRQQATGTGLGMLLIYSIITVRLHGSIDVASIPGQGVKFEIQLPPLGGG